MSEFRPRGILYAVLAILAGLSFASAANSEPVRVLFLTGESDQQYHHWELSTPFLRAVLEQTGRFEVKVLEEVDGVTSRTLEDYDVLVLNYNGPRWEQQTETAIEDFLHSGGGMISFHGVSYGRFFGQVRSATRGWEADNDPGWRAYPKMLGASWKPKNIGHAKRHVYPVKWVDAEHPIAQGLPPTFLANDELYHRMDLAPDTHVLATAYSDPATGGTGNEEPQIWTVRFGQGRTVHLTLGHDLAAMVQPGFLAAFARGAEWAATGAVTLPTEIHPPSTRSSDAIRALVVTGGHSYPAAFYTLFEGYDDLVWDHATTRKGAFTAEMKDRYDVVVLHDMYDEIAESERANLRAFVESGKGVVSIHHAIVDYTSWPWWYQKVTGGKYFIKATRTHPKSHFKEGVDMVVTPVEAHRNHPVLRGVAPIAVNDEAYHGMWHSPDIVVLMETDYELNDRPVVYLGPHPDIRSVYIQLGHGEDAIRHPAYRRLVINSIRWASGR